MVFCARSYRLAGALILPFLPGVTQPAQATSLTFEGYIHTLNVGGSITLSSPAALAVDPSGNVFIADTNNSQIVEVNAQGSASVLIINGLSPASLSSPAGIAIDGAGNVYVADTGNNRVVKVSASGAGTTIGTGSVTLSSPEGVALDPFGDLFIADSGNNRIVEVTAGGSAAALSITVSSGPASLSSPKGLAVDVSGKLYIADSSHNRVVTVAAGSATGMVLSTGGLSPGLSAPSSVAVDRFGNVYAADSGNNRITELDNAGYGFSLLSNSSYLQGTTLSAPLGVAIDISGGVYIADTGASRVLVVDPYLDADAGSGLGYTSSLNKTAVGFGHIALGSASPNSMVLSFTVGSPVASLSGVSALTTGAETLDFQVVSGANTTCNSTTAAGQTCSVEVSFLPTAPGLRKGAVVLYGASQTAYLTVPLYGWGDAPVAALAPNTGTKISSGGVALNEPFQIALDAAGNIYDANLGGNLVKIPAGGGTATVISPASPYNFTGELAGVALDGAGNLFVSDHDDSRIVVITPGGVASVLSISGLSPALFLPTAMAFDAAGNLYISDYGNGRVVEVSCLLVAGSTSKGIGTVISTGIAVTSAEEITGVAVDSMGTIYIPDGYAGADTSRVIKVTAAGVVSLLAPAGITFSRPEGVSADGMGNIYIADGGNNRIVEITTAGVVSVLALSGLPSPATLGEPFSVTADPSGNLYIPDLANNRVLYVNVSGAPLAFPNTAKGATSAAKTATVTNLGNEPLVFSANPAYTANFSNNSSDTNPCTSSTSLNAGMFCDVSVEFTPQSVGSLSAGITVTDNTLNVAASTQLVSVSGTAFYLGDTTSTAVTISPGALVRGQPATITATVTDTASPPSFPVPPTGPVTFMDLVGSTMTTLNGGSPVSLSGGHASLTGVVLSGVGTHTITASYAGVTNDYISSSNTNTVVLSKALATVTGPATQPVAVTYGQTGSAALTVTAPYTTISEPSGSVSYSILNSSLTVVASGAPTLTVGSNSSTATIPIPNTLAPGSYTISATYNGDGNYLASPAITIQAQVSQITPTLGWSPSTASIVYGTTLSGILNATAQNGATAIPGTFAYTATPNAGSASPVNSTSLLSAGGYTLTATFTPTDAVTYRSASTTLSFTVSRATPSITWGTPAAIAYGSALGAAELNASSPVAGTFAYTPAAGTVVTAGQHTLAVTFTPSDATDYNLASAQIALTVNQATPPVTWASPAAIAYGTALDSAQLNASSPVEGTFTYTPAAGTVETAGQHTLSVTFTPADTTDYTSATAQVTLTVHQPAPSINWPTPAPIPYGTALSRTELDASSTVAGTFVYTPPLGTVETAGRHTLSVTFTPTDSTDYSAASAQVTLTVEQATPAITLSSSVNPTLVKTAVTFSAAVHSPAGTPTGSVDFFDGTTLLASVALANGAAAFTTSTLAVGSHAISAHASGDENFNAVSSGQVAEVVQDFTVGVPPAAGGSSSANTTSQTVVAGGTATYTLALGPTNGVTFPVPVTLSVSGLPPGASATVTPPVIPAGYKLTDVMLVIQLPASTASLERKQPPGRGMPPALWTILLLPLAGKLRRAGKKLSGRSCLLLMLAAIMAATVGLSGCGGGNGFFGQQEGTYIVTLTASAGPVAHSTTVTLTVE